jgi:GTPase Era involved in 16S rRNA processing
VTVPVFAVVGRPNKGKSSIVATLARDDAVYIDARAGSTREARRYPMKVDGETLYELVDTPGLQRARAVLDWLRAHCADAAARPAAVKAFVEQHEGDPRYRDECQALRPVVDGAGIIYVVDGSCPYGADYEAEMEILRWSGRPSLALINPIEGEEFVEEWSAGLGQFFRTVRTFNAHRAEVSKQLELLELFGHLDPAWRQPLERAVAILRQDRQLQVQGAASFITDLIVEAINYKVEQAVPDGLPLEPVQKLLFERYKAHLVRRERQCRQRVEELYYYTHLKKSEQGLTLEESDLFNIEQWYLWGLGEKSLLVVAASAGALVGGTTGIALDAASGGLLGGLGTLVAGAGGAVSGVWGARKYADKIGQVKVKGIPTGGQLVSYGPSRNINFPFVLLGRALLHQRLISIRTHADRNALDLSQPLLDWLGDSQRKRLARIFDDIRNDRKPGERRAELGAMIANWCDDGAPTQQRGG